MSDNDTDALLHPSLEYDEVNKEDQGSSTSIQIHEGQTMDPYLEESDTHNGGSPVDANVVIQPRLDKNQEIRSKPAVLRNVPSSENTNVQIVRMPIAFPNPLSNRDAEEPEYDSATSAALSRYKYYKHLEKYSASNNGKPAAEPVLVMPEHMLPSRFLTILNFPKKITGKQKSIITIFALWNTMMGTALLSMPWAIKKAGFANGVMLLILIAFLMFYSAYRIMSCTLEMAHLGFKDFSDVCRHFLGEAGYIMCTICSLISLIGGMIVYWILLSNFMYNTVKYFFLQSNDQFKNSTYNSSVEVLCPNRDAKNQTLDGTAYFTPFSEKLEEFNHIWQLTRTVPLFLLLILFPLINFKSPTFFTKFNSLASVSVMYLIIFTIVKSVKWGVNIQFSNSTGSFYSPNFNQTFPSLTGIASLAYFIHNCIIAIVQNQEKPENNARDLGIAFFLVCITYLIIGVGLYITFPDKKSCICDNILDNLPLDDIWAVIARLFIFLQLGAIFPLLIYVYRIQLLHVTFKVIWPGLHIVILLNLFTCGLCIVFACFLPYIGKVIGYVGAFCGFSYALALPLTVYLLSSYEKGTLTGPIFTIHVILMMLGLANFIAQFFV